VRQAVWKTRREEPSREGEGGVAEQLIEQPIRAYRTELAPADDSQVSLLYRNAGAARFAYNWGVEWKMNVMEHNQRPQEEEVPLDVRTVEVRPAGGA